jgi:16S rRNA (guanine966-N2)-methyltransferase
MARAQQPLPGVKGSTAKGELRLSGGRRLKSPKGDGTRPTTGLVRQAVMNMLAPELHGCHWLDLCSGSGVMGCEAMLRGAMRVLAIEKNPGTAAICRENMAATATGLSPSPSHSVICADLRRWLGTGRPESDPGFDLVYFDPPYAAGLYAPGLDLLLRGQWLRDGALVICEHAIQAIPELPQGWQLRDQRRYGNSGLLLISPPGHCPGGTGSRRQQTDPPG